MKQILFIISACLMWISFCFDNPLLAIIGIAQMVAVGFLTHSFDKDLFTTDNEQ